MMSFVLNTFKLIATVGLYKNAYHINALKCVVLNEMAQQILTNQYCIPKNTHNIMKHVSPYKWKILIVKFRIESVQNNILK